MKYRTLSSEAVRREVGFRLEIMNRSQKATLQLDHDMIMENLLRSEGPGKKSSRWEPCRRKMRGKTRTRTEMILWTGAWLCTFLDAELHEWCQQATLTAGCRILLKPGKDESLCAARILAHVISKTAWCWKHPWKRRLMREFKNTTQAIEPMRNLAFFLRHDHWAAYMASLCHSGWQWDKR